MAYRNIAYMEVVKMRYGLLVLVIPIVLLIGCHAGEVVDVAEPPLRPPTTRPTAPFLLYPDSDATNIPTTMILRWTTSHDSDGPDAVRYYLTLSPMLFGSQDSMWWVNDTFYAVRDLRPNTSYLWYVMSNDGALGNTSGQEWFFRTAP